MHQSDIYLTVLLHSTIIQYAKYSVNAFITVIISTQYNMQNINHSTLY